MSAEETALAPPVRRDSALANRPVLRPGMGDISMRVHVTIPLPALTLRSLQNLHTGQLLRTEVDTSEDVPLGVSNTVLGHAELHNADGTMAVRLTRMS